MEKTTVAVWSLFALLVAPASAQDPEYGKLHGEFHITGEHDDLAPEDKRDRVAFSLRGETAKAIFDAMPVPARHMDCDGKPMENFPLRKVAGELECSKDNDGTYYCTVAVNLETGQTTTYAVCDPSSVE
jgi:hypothetical protein